ncbi:MAG: NAD(P)H-dependent oxidoreductase [Hydrogenothermaceae bacterium]
MDAVILYAHPNPASFNNAIKDTVIDTLKNKGKSFSLRDLYSMNFDPVLTGRQLYDIFVNSKVDEDVKQEQEIISQAKTLIVIHPIWWSGMPAILKGYIDRVFTYGFAYREENGEIVGLLKGKKVVIVNTFGADERELSQFGIKECFEKIYYSIYGFCGIEEIKTKFLFAVPYVSDEDRKKMLEEVRDFIEVNL